MGNKTRTSENRGIIYAVFGGVMLISFQVYLFFTFTFTPTISSGDLGHSIH